MEKALIKGRRRARKLALQALYQWLMTGHDPLEIELQFCLTNDMQKVDEGYFKSILYYVTGNPDEVDEAFAPWLDREIARLNPVELSVLRLAACELLQHPEVPCRVVLDEAVILAKTFGSQDGYRYVNGVLNNMVRQLPRFHSEAGNNG